MQREKSAPRANRKKTVPDFRTSASRAACSTLVMIQLWFAHTYWPFAVLSALPYVSISHIHIFTLRQLGYEFSKLNQIPVWTKSNERIPLSCQFHLLRHVPNVTDFSIAKLNLSQCCPFLSIPVDVWRAATHTENHFAIIYLILRKSAPNNFLFVNVWSLGERLHNKIMRKIDSVPSQPSRVCAYYTIEHIY